MQRTDNHIPDVLDCLASLSNDEVFTPPRVVNQMLDLLPEEVFKSRETTFLDPFTKSGVFLREITKRLLEYQVPKYNDIAFEIEQITKLAIQEAVSLGKLNPKDNDYELKARAIGDAAIKKHKDAARFFQFRQRLQEALDHILTKQVFGIAITELTAQLARRSLYCSKNAAGQYSISESVFKGNSNGNIRFVSMKHTWRNGSCVYCGASASNLDRPDDYESHAYEFIHVDNPEEIFMGLGFTVICGNPPYHLRDGGNDSSATPIYNEFVNKAIALNPHYLIMIIPSRWMQAGKGLDNFRKNMMDDLRISYLVDFADDSECFPASVHVDGGVCYFLWNRDYKGQMHHVFHSNRHEVIETNRFLRSPLSDVVIRDYRQISILEKVRSFSEEVITSIVSSRKPFGVATDLFNNPSRYPDANMNKTFFANSVHIFGVKGHKGGAKRVDAYVDKDFIVDNGTCDKYKLFFTTSYSSNAVIPPEPIRAFPGDVCTETFLTFGNFNTENEMNNCYDYIHTTFFRALLYFRRGSLRVTKSVFNYIPLQDFSKSWTDVELYAKYNFTKEEINFIESLIKPMK